MFGMVEKPAIEVELVEFALLPVEQQRTSMTPSPLTKSISILRFATLWATCHFENFELTTATAHIYSSMPFWCFINQVHNHDGLLHIAKDQVHVPIVCLTKRAFS